MHEKNMIKQIIIVIGLTVMCSLAKAEKTPNKIVGIILNHSSLKGFIHGRVPIKVSGKINKEIKVIAFGKPVEVSGSKNIKDDVIEFYQCTIKGSECVVRFSYRIEGLDGEVNLKRSKSGVWSVVKYTLIEQ